MILLKENTVDGKPIEAWVVWFRSPLGLHKSLEAALLVCENYGLDPELLLQPVAVAQAGGVYEQR